MYFLSVVQICKYIKYIQKIVHKYTNWSMYCCETGVNFVSLIWFLQSYFRYSVFVWVYTRQYCILYWIM